ncbi:hypothetical protein [Winogradskyella pulchriflava]|uniref:Tissue inhibitor of metalloproteinase n=1 Tax=Winogradskyella pulchriflava TaxID=1110688 RepID=A0ABV6QAU7_9FLAO
MRKTIFMLTILCGISGFGQELTCEDFKEGTFKTEVSEPIKIKWEIIRTQNEQTEIIKEIPEEYKDLGYPSDPHYVKIEWIDDCSYRATYDDSKSKLTESQKFINSIGGITTEVIKIEGNCFYYKSIMKVEEHEQVMEGKMCKE